MMPPFVQRLVAVAVTVMLIEVTHKVSTLQQLLEFQDQNTKVELQAWNIPTAMKNQAERAGVNFLPSRIQQAPPSRSSEDSACRIPPAQGPEGRMGFQALTKIQLSKGASSASSTSRRILCIVLTDSTQHETVLQAAMDTYAPLCDGFLAASNQTDVARGAIDLGDASKEWERLQRVWNYVREHDRYRNDFDAFHFGGDGMYVIPENLRTMLSHYDQFSTNSHQKQQQPMYLGGAVVPSRKTPSVRYCGGGAGYTLNRAALDLAPRLSECPQNTQSLPVDQQLAQCLGQVANLQCGKTADSTSALRYLEFGLDYQAQWSKSVKGPIKSKPLAEHHGIYMRQGLGSIAADAVSFHLVGGTEPLAAFTVAETMRRVHAILRGHCKSQWDQPTTALDAQGNPGYVHDPTHLRKHPLSFTTHPAGNEHDVCEAPFGSGIEGTMGHQGLQKIRVMSSNSTNNNKKVLCLIYTHSNRHDRVRAIAETYGARCDGFLAASNLTDPSIGAVNLQHEGSEECKLYIRLEGLIGIGKPFCLTHPRHLFPVFRRKHVVEGPSHLAIRLPTLSR
jgi:glycoprotein-N-acetylgalactosamine 3-beta-galactosyltransferase